MQKTDLSAKVEDLSGRVIDGVRALQPAIVHFSCAIFMLFAAVGCTSDPHAVDIKGAEVTVELKRLDEDLFERDADLPVDVAALQERYGEFLRDYTVGVLRIGDPSDPGFAFSINQFTSDASMRTLYDDSRKDYADVADIHTQLNTAFSYFHHHFPDSTVPQVVINISGLNFAIVATRTTLAIGVDMFLGAEYPVYPMVGLPQYMFRNMKRDQVVPQAMKGWFQSMYESSAASGDMLSDMIFHGKVLYAMDATLVGWADSSKIGYTRDEMDWCKENETQVWAHLSEQQMLFSTDRLLITKWIDQAPFIAGIPKQSPGRLGQWVGWQIVRRFMQRHPETALQELMTISPQEILSRSRYKPDK